MATMHHTCDECGSEFSIKYDENQVESDPQNCPFCGEYIYELGDLEEDDE